MATDGPAKGKNPATVRGRQTRESLLYAAREVFEEDGFLDARVSDIARRAGVAHGTFYVYFDDKESIFRELVTRLVGEMFAGSSESSSADPVDRIEAATRRYLSTYAANARLMTVFEQVATFNDYFRQLSRDLRKVFVDRAAGGIVRWQQEGLVDPAIEAAIAGNALGGMVENFARVWLVLDEPVDAEKAVKTLSRLWASALGLDIHRSAGRDRDVDVSAVRVVEEKRASNQYAPKGRSLEKSSSAAPTGRRSQGALRSGRARPTD
jgi:AcrR family transcriptional regulator